MTKGVAYTPKTESLPDLEFLSTMHQEGKEALYILRMLRNWMDRDAKEGAAFHTKNMVKYWSKKADDLFLGIPHENSIEPKPFKSLMQQLAEGELSYKPIEHEAAA